MLRLEVLLVDLSLVLRQPTEEHLFVLRRQLENDALLRFDPANEILLDGVPQDTRALVRRLHFDRTGVGVATARDRNGEVFHEGGQSAEFAREDEVEQRPQLAQIVLHRRTGENQSVSGAELPETDRVKRKRMREEQYRFTGRTDLGVGIANLMALVENKVMPGVGDESVVVNENIRVGGDQNARRRSTHFLDQAILERKGSSCFPRGQ